jgi:CubicO group peptidase (beta-lactamase class C family)
MVLTKLTLPLIVILLYVPGCQPTKQPQEKPFTVRMDELFQKNNFNGVVLIADKGKPVYYKSFGYRNFDQKTLLDTSDVFELASLSKAFTAMIIMMLAEDGLLTYEDPVNKYIPELPYPGITIRHLLQHTSGLPDYQVIMDQYWDKTKIAGNEENIAYLVKYQPKASFAPGEKYEYSNTGYMLLASVAERVSGKDFIELCQQRIFLPLRMDQTQIRSKNEKVALNNMAWGYIWVPEKQAYVHADSFPAFNYSIWLGNRKGPGRVSASASDLLKWDQAFYSEASVGRETLKEAFKPARLNDGSTSSYGFGWMLGDHPTLGRKIFHTGDNPGYRTMIVRFPDEQKTIIVLSNNEYKLDNLLAEIEDEISKQRR